MLRTADVLRSVAADDCFVSVDLKDAYFYVPIAVHLRKFLRFSFQNQAYQLKVLPFALSLAPRVFTRCVSAALSPLWMRGMRILPHLDDWLLCAHTKPHAVQDSKLLLRHVQKLGFSVNEKKSYLIPAQTNNVHRNDSKFLPNVCLPVSGTRDKHSATLDSLLARCVFTLLDSPTTNRDVNSCYSGDSPWFTPPPTTPVMEQQFMTQPRPTSPSTDCNFSQLHSCVEAVETGRISDGRSTPWCCSLSMGISHNRCFPHRLGGNMESEGHLWAVDTYSGQRTYQPAGTTCSVYGSKVFLASPCSCSV